MVVGMMGLGVASANHVRTHARHATFYKTPFTFSDDQLVDTLNPIQAGTVMDVENTALTQPTGNLAGG